MHASLELNRTTPSHRGHHAGRVPQLALPGEGREALHLELGCQGIVHEVDARTVPRSLSVQAVQPIAAAAILAPGLDWMYSKSRSFPALWDNAAGYR